jgi:ATP:corrinoid adenosyltransferase
VGQWLQLTAVVAELVNPEKATVLATGRGCESSYLEMASDVVTKLDKEVSKNQRGG